MMLKPYYETELGKLYHGDCLEIMPELEPVDLVLTDPPYGINYKHGGGNYRNAPTVISAVIGDDKPFDPSFLPRPMIVWGANHYHHRLPEGGRWFIWDKREGIIPPRDQADCEIAWCSQGGVDRLFNHYWDGFNRKSERKIPRQHPTQKPVALMAWCINQASNPKSILDPFIGSGTTTIACERLKRRWIGIEISEEYCEISARRIERETSQLKLW